MKKRLCVFASGSGTNMQAVMDEIDKGSINGEIVLLVASASNIGAIERAQKKGIPVRVFSKKDFATPQERDKAIVQVLKEFDVDYIILAGYLAILTKEIISQYPNRIINIHPSLLPKFGGKGMYGINVHKAVIQAKEKYSGATVHFVDEGADTGPIILQRRIRVRPDDDEYTLQQKILTKIEHKLLPYVVKLLCEDRIKVINNKVVIDYVDDNFLRGALI
ncbi:MAG TPA: phosphoribosylglycinamide formyltransferase [Clostridia bacterium]